MKKRILSARPCRLPSGRCNKGAKLLPCTEVFVASIGSKLPKKEKRSLFPRRYLPGREGRYSFSKRMPASMTAMPSAAPMPQLQPRAGGSTAGAAHCSR